MTSQEIISETLYRKHYFRHGDSYYCEIQEAERLRSTMFDFIWIQMFSVMILMLQLTGKTAYTDINEISGMYFIITVDDVI